MNNLAYITFKNMKYKGLIDGRPIDYEVKYRGSGHCLGYIYKNSNQGWKAYSWNNIGKLECIGTYPTRNQAAEELKEKRTQQ